MKKILFLALACIAAGCSTAPDGFEVRIRLENAPEGFIYVSERIPNPTEWFIDTLPLNDGEIIYTGKVDYPRLTTFTLWESRDEFLGSFSLFLDNSRVEITGDFNKLSELEISGSPANDDYTRIERNGDEYFAAYRKLQAQRSASFAADPKLYDSLEAPSEAAHQRLVDYLLNAPGYATSPASPYFIYEHIPSSDIDNLQRALDALDSSLQTNGYVTVMAEKLRREKGSAPGQQAFDFELQDLDGNTHRLSDYRGKYVLLEFSASWCGWCKLEIPYLKTVFEHTQGKDFVMFTVNLDDERAKWEQEVDENPVPWRVISDLKAFESPVAVNYNVSGIPEIYLISPDGVIIEKGLRREYMIETIDALFADE